MSQNQVYDLIIIGGGPGGLTAGIYAIRSALKTVLFEKSAAGGQMINSGEIENWPGIEKIDGAELSMNFANHAASYGLETRYEEITRIEPANPQQGRNLHSVYLADNTEFRTYALILAAGGSPRKLDVPGEKENHGKGVSYCAICDGFFFKNKITAVVGGGDAAVEEALYLAKICKKVFLIHRRDQLRAGRILQDRVFNEPKIEVLWNKIVTNIKADAAVNGAQLEDTATGEKSDISVDGVFVFTGFIPNNTLIPQGVELDKKGHVITDEKCETAIKGIYAAGDIRKKYARQIVTATADGATAALAAAAYIEKQKAL